MIKLQIYLYASHDKTTNLLHHMIKLQIYLYASHDKTTNLFICITW